MTAQDPELSAALGWPGGISDPVLDRKVLLQMVAALMQDKLWEDHRVKHLWDHVQEQAEPVQEPVAWLAPRIVDSCSRPDLGYETCSKSDYGAFPAYTAPPQRKLVPLTEEEISAMAQKTWKPSVYYDAFSLLGTDGLVALVRAVEKASWEKNHGQA